ncbi:hypothetical protein [Azospirillum doebereinerae]
MMSYGIHHIRHSRKNDNPWERVALLPLREKGWDEGYSP